MAQNNNPPTEVLQSHIELDTPVSRRSVLKGVGALATIAVLPEVIRPAATKIGEVYDSLASLETLLTQRAMIPLEPRESDTPVVEPKLRGEPIGVRTHYTHHDEMTVLHFDDDAPLRAEHTDMPIDDTEFVAAGTAIITTAEGLQNGEQAYCQLFSGDSHTLAVGYEGGLYAYEPALGQADNRGEWVRIITTSSESGLSSHAMSTASWGDLTSAKPDKLLIEDVTSGAETLRALGYKPFGAVLASTGMSEEKEFTFAPENFAQTPQEVMDYAKPYFITNEGVVVDVQHLEAKADETFELFAQLFSQQVSGETHPTATVRYSVGDNAQFTFVLTPASLAPDTIVDTTFAVMNATSTLMEGVSQRYAVEKMPLLASASESSGMSHEDLFTNTLGISTMLALIKEYGLAKTLQTEEDAHALVEELKPQFVSRVLAQTAQIHGVRSFDTPITTTLPRGIYSLIPVKIDPEGTTSPARIITLLRVADITTDNPKVQFTPTHVPVIQSTADHVLTKAGL